jgi:hypothetical protein
MLDGSDWTIRGRQLALLQTTISSRPDPRSRRAVMAYMKLPRAILFDLDDTILVAFEPAQSQWHNGP